MEIEVIKGIALIVGAIVALVTLIKGVFEYTKQGAQKRYEMFSQVRSKLKDTREYQEICSSLEENSERLLNIEFKHKRDFLGLFEEVAIMLNSRLISKEVAFYMFGYYAIRCWESSNFWSGVNKESLYWSVFSNFVTKMKEIESTNFIIPDKIRY